MGWKASGGGGTCRRLSASFGAPPRWPASRAGRLSVDGRTQRDHSGAVCPGGQECCATVLFQGRVPVRERARRQPGRKLTDGPFDEQPAPSPIWPTRRSSARQTPPDFGGGAGAGRFAELRPVAPPRRLVDPADLPPSRGGSAPVSRASPVVTGRKAGGPASSTARTTGGARRDPDGRGGPTRVFCSPDRLHRRGRAPFAGPNLRVGARRQSHRLDERNAATSDRSTSIPWPRSAESTRPSPNTNAFSVTYARDGQAILFTNGEAPATFASRPFAVHTGGIFLRCIRRSHRPTRSAVHQGGLIFRRHRCPGLRCHRLQRAGRRRPVEVRPGTRQRFVTTAHDGHRRNRQNRSARQPLRAPASPYRATARVGFR